MLTVQFVGEVTFQQYNNWVTIGVTKIKNNRNGRTGTLLMQLITSDNPIEPGLSVNYHIVAQYQLTQIPNNHYIGSFTRTLPMKNPFSRKYTAILLLQYREEGYVCVHYVNFSNTNQWNPQRTLYHGTTQQNAQRIKRSNLRPSSHGRLGPGIYFTENKWEAMKL